MGGGENEMQKEKLSVGSVGNIDNPMLDVHFKSWCASGIGLSYSFETLKPQRTLRWFSFTISPGKTNNFIKFLLLLTFITSQTPLTAINYRYSID